MANKEQTQNEDTIPCDECGKPAIYNFQKLWVVAEINGDTSGIPDNQEPESEESIFRCKECAGSNNVQGWTFDKQFRTITYGDWKTI